MACCDWPSRAAQYPMPKWHWTTRLFWMPFSISHSTGKPPLSLLVFIPAMDLCRLPKHYRHFTLLILRSYMAALGHYSDGVITASLSAYHAWAASASCSARCTGSSTLRVWHIKLNPVITDEVALLQASGSTSRPFRFDEAKPPKLS